MRCRPAVTARHRSITPPASHAPTRQTKGTRARSKHLVQGWGPDSAWSGRSRLIRSEFCSEECFEKTTEGGSRSGADADFNSIRSSEWNIIYVTGCNFSLFVHLWLFSPLTRSICRTIWCLCLMTALSFLHCVLWELLELLFIKLFLSFLKRIKQRFKLLMIHRFGYHKII